MIVSTDLLGLRTLAALLGLNVDQGELCQDGPLESLDLNAAALAESDPMLERSRLISRGFVHARFGRWETPVGDVITITVYEFTDAQQARLSVCDLHEALRAAGANLLNGDTNRDPDVSLASVTSIDDAVSFHSVTCAMAIDKFQILVVSGAGVSAEFVCPTGGLGVDVAWATPKQIRSVASAQAQKLATTSAH